MARKDILINQLVLGQSLAATFTSQPTLIPFLDNCSYQINVKTTDSIGTFKVQVSLDYAVNNVGNPNEVTNAGNWVDLDIGGTPVANAANDTIIIDMNQLPFKATRLVYTSGTAGTGTCDIFISDKQIGG